MTEEIVQALAEPHTFTAADPVMLCRVALDAVTAIPVDTDESATILAAQNALEAIGVASLRISLMDTPSELLVMLHDIRGSLYTRLEVAKVKREHIEEMERAVEQALKAKASKGGRARRIRPPAERMLEVYNQVADDLGYKPVKYDTSGKTRAFYGRVLNVFVQAREWDSDPIAEGYVAPSIEGVIKGYSRPDIVKLIGL